MQYTWNAATVVGIHERGLYNGPSLLSRTSLPLTRPVVSSMLLHPTNMCWVWKRSLVLSRFSRHSSNLITLNRRHPSSVLLLKSVHPSLVFPVGQKLSLDTRWTLFGRNTLILWTSSSLSSGHRECYAIPLWLMPRWIAWFRWIRPHLCGKGTCPPLYQ